MLGTQTRGSKMEGADESTELSRHPVSAFVPSAASRTCFCDSHNAPAASSRITHSLNTKYSFNKVDLPKPRSHLVKNVSVTVLRAS